MSRFNTKASDKYVEKNFEGDKAFVPLSQEMNLYLQTCASMLQPTYYVPDVEDQLNKLRTTIKSVNPEFVAKLAVYVREKMYLRTMPLVLTVELAKIHNKTDLVKRLTNRVVQRADEITELLSYYVEANKENTLVLNNTTKKLRKVSNQIRKGIKEIFESGKFNEYQFSKYNNMKNEIKFRDALFLTHPKPKNATQKTLFHKIANNLLDTAYTWETQMSESGKIGRDKKEVWEEMIDSGKMGYMAILRNLRNFIQTGVSPEHIEKVAKVLSDSDMVRKSKQLPFRFFSAYKSLKDLDIPSVLLDSLEKAIKVSIENIPIFEKETVLIASDVSGSMFSPVSKKSLIEPFDIGLLLSMLVRFNCRKCVTGIFGDIWKVIDGLPKDSILKAMDDIVKRNGEVGYSTNGWKVLDWALKSDMEFDRIMMFTDEQMWESSYMGSSTGRINVLWKEYKKQHPNTKLYIFNLSNYAKLAFDPKGKDVYTISGWSDQVFKVMENIEKGEEVLDEIYKIEL